MNNIVFDIDDTIVNETGFMIKNAPRFLKRHYGIAPEIKNPNGYKLSEVFALDECFINLSDEQIKEKCAEIDNKFWTKNYLKYIFQPLKKDVRSTINDLKRLDYRIYFVSTRGKKTKENEKIIDSFIRLKVVPFLTKAQINFRLIKYNQIKLVQNETEKIEFIKYIKAKFVFDDQIGVLDQVPDNTIPVCMEANHNKNRILSEKILRVTSFEEDEVKKLILENSKLKKRLKKKKYDIVTPYERFFTECFYIFVRTCFKNLFIKKFQTIICGLENIPNDKRAVIFAGNHRHNLDPLIVTLFVKKPTHWAALLRLFQAKENLFGRNDIPILRKLSAILIKAIGSVPIARQTDENYSEINLNSLLKLENYIKLGSSIGFYPEGTKNKQPEMQNILPLASDVIFSIARHNNAWLQPFSVVWTPEDIHIPNKVVLIFHKAIETTGMSVNEIKQQWYEAVNGGIDRTKELFEEIRKIELGTTDEGEKKRQKSVVLSNFIKN